MEPAPPVSGRGNKLRRIMKKVVLCICLALALTGCPAQDKEKIDLTKEIISLKSQIKIAKEVETLKVERDALLAELHTIQTKPEAAPATSASEAAGDNKED
ncbi:MAG: hypothetical protein ACW99J_17830 [Candidatus Thorarchaeota archaeon]|jgi:hypothetical protein